MVPVKQSISSSTSMISQLNYCICLRNIAKLFGFILLLLLPHHNVVIDAFVIPTSTAGSRLSREGSHPAWGIKKTLIQHPHETTMALYSNLDSICNELEKAFMECEKDIVKTCKVKVAPVSSCDNRLGLIATKSIKKGEVILSMPYNDENKGDGCIVLSSTLARDTVYKGILPDEYDGWTGDNGLIALLLLNEVALAAEAPKGIQLPKRSKALQTFMNAWVKSLPTSEEMIKAQSHPLLWPEEYQEILQSSSTTKIYRTLDDIEEDVTWLIENVFDKDRNVFPESVNWKIGEEEVTIPCFSLEGYKWAMAMVQSRSVFVDAKVRLIPIMDMCNHDGEIGQEIQGGYMGTFNTIQGGQLVSATNYNVGDEVYVSYGPKSAIDYLLEHGFVPEECWKTCVSELTFELDPEDRFYDDKLDILEFETYDQAPMDPVQSFDVISGTIPGRGDGEPDPAMTQFLRLCQLGGTDAFLLESIFKSEVWGFMALPVSEGNELGVVTMISKACERALEELNDCPSSDEGDEGGPLEICKKIRESESKAIRRTSEYIQREKEALDLKEYYQERRLKDLGLDSEWSPEDDILGGDPDESSLGFGQKRAPGGADYDW